MESQKFNFLDSKEEIMFFTCGKDWDSTPSFKRMFYDSLVKFVTKSEYNFCALLGPRQIGKTIALRQVFEKFYRERKAYFYDFKTIVASGEDTEDICYKIIETIEKGMVDLLIFDEITYVKNYSVFLRRLNDVVDSVESTVKIILTGSSYSMIARSCKTMIANNIVYLRVSFLSFYEYLVRKKKIKSYRTANFSLDSLRNLEECTELKTITTIDFMDYVKNSYKFTHFVSIRDYLEHCVDENIVSRTNSMWESPDNIRTRVNVEVTVSLLYCILYTLHKNPSWVKFKNNPKEFTSEFRNVKNATGMKHKQFTQYVISTILFEKVQALQGISWTVLRNSIHFLYESGLITFQFTNYDMPDNELKNWLIGETIELANHKITNVIDFLTYVNPIIISPIPYVAIVQDLCDVLEMEGYFITLDDVLKEDLFGSFLETLLKGVFSFTTTTKCLNEFKQDVFDEKGQERSAEIDLCDHEHHLLIEISKTDKKLQKTWFDYFPRQEFYSKILIGDYLNGEDSLESERVVCCERVAYHFATLWLDSIIYTKLLKV